MNAPYWSLMSFQLLQNEVVYTGVAHLSELESHIRNLPKGTNYTIRKLNTIECDYSADDNRYADNTFQSARWCLIIRK